MKEEDFYPNDRKLRSKTVLLFIFFIVPAFNSYGQCDNGTNFYPSATYTPAVSVWAPATASNYAGQVIKVNVKIGDVYQFSTCSGYGGVSASYNTELTLSQTDGTLLTYSDDYSGCGYQSYISWTATFTGVVHLHLNAINIHTHCSSNSITTQVMIFRSIANADFIWTGAVSVDWNNGGNWDQGGLLPTAANNCIIPYTLSNNPVVDAIAVCKDLLSAGSFTVMPNGQLNVNGKLTDSLGFINVSSGGKLDIAGNATFVKGFNYNVMGEIEVDGATVIGSGYYLNIVQGIFDANGSFDATGVNIVTPEGKLCLGSTVISLGDLSSTLGTVVYDGSTAQSIDQAVTFNNLIINNAAGVTLKGQVNVNGKLTFINGNIISVSPNNVIGINIGGTIIGASASSHVVGPVGKETNTLYPFTFPTGDGTNYKPCTITPTSTTPTSWTAQYYPAAHANYSTITGTGIDHVSSSYYWDITRHFGSANAIVTLNWNGISGVTVPADVIVAHYNGTAWEKVGATPIITGNASLGSVQADIASTSFSPFTLGSGTSNNPLPIDLLSFGVNCQNDLVDVTFSVASQVNNHYFIIERSTDAMGWEEVGTLPGVGTSSKQMNYSFADANPTKGISYYRLVQVDYDGNSQTFYPVSTSCGANYSKGLSLNAYPNPADSEVTIKLELEEYQGSHVYYTIMDIRGSVVASDQINLDMGYNKQVINVNNLASGTYFLRMHNTRTHIAEARIIKR